MSPKMSSKFSKTTVYGNPFIGIYCRTNDEITIVGTTISNSFMRAAEVLGTKIVKTTIADSDLIGIYSAMNKNGIILPLFASEAEKKFFERRGLNAEIIKSKFTAIGNNIAANDKGAMINPRMKGDKKTIGDVLGVEVVESMIAGFQTVGAAIFTTNKGFIAHPNASDEEIKLIKSVLHVDGGIGTVNTGVPFPSLAMVANSNGFITGETTTGYETHRISECLDLI